MTADACHCAAVLKRLLKADGEDVTVTTDPPDQFTFTLGTRAWRCPDGNLFYTVPTAGQIAAWKDGAA